MREEKIFKILKVFKKEEKPLHIRSPEFTSIPESTLEYYFDILENDYGFLKVFKTKNTKNEIRLMRITLSGNNFLKNYSQKNSKIGFK